MIKMTEEKISNYGLECEEDALRNLDEIIARAEEDIKNGNVCEAKQFFKQLKEGKYDKLLQSNFNA